VRAGKQGFESICTCHGRRQPLCQSSDFVEQTARLRCAQVAARARVRVCGSPCAVGLFLFRARALQSGPHLQRGASRAAAASAAAAATLLAAALLPLLLGRACGAGRAAGLVLPVIPVVLLLLVTRRRRWH
jgi:hypothetical protein